MVTGVLWQTISANLLSSSCRVRRTGVEQALEYLDTMLLGGDAEQISNCVSVLVAFANSSFGCAGFDPKTGLQIRGYSLDGRSGTLRDGRMDTLATPAVGNLRTGQCKG